MSGHPVKEEFTKPAANDDTYEAHYCDEVGQFAGRNAVQFSLGELQQNPIAYHKSRHVRKTVPPQRKRGAGYVQDDGIEVMNVGGDEWNHVNETFIPHFVRLDKPVDR